MSAFPGTLHDLSKLGDLEKDHLSFGHLCDVHYAVQTSMQQPISKGLMKTLIR